MSTDLGEAILTLKTDSSELTTGLASGEDSARSYSEASETEADKAQKSWEESFNLTKIAMTALSVEGFKKLIEVAGEMVDAFAEDEAAELKFNAALASSGDLVPHNVTNMNNLVTSFSTLTGTTKESAEGMLTLLAATGRTDDQMRDMLTAADDLSNATGMDLNTALTQLDATFSGNIGRLGRLTPALKDLTDEQLKNGVAVQTIIEQYQGMDKVLANSAEVEIKNYKNAWHEAFAALGAGINENLKPLREDLTNVAHAISDNDSGLNKFAASFNAYVAAIGSIGSDMYWPNLKYAIDLSTGALDALIQKEKDYWKIMDAVNASAEGAAARSKALAQEAAKIRAEEAAKAAKAEQDAAEKTAAFDQYIADKRGKAWDIYFKALEKKQEDDVKAAKKAADQVVKDAEAAEKKEEKNAKDSLDLRNKLLIDAQKEAAAATAAYDAQETQNAKDAADLRTKLLIDELNEQEAEAKAIKDKAEQEDKARQDRITGYITGATKSIFEEMGKEIDAGKLTWKSLGEAAVHAIGKIVSSMGDQLAASAAADLVIAIADTASVVLAPAAPGYYASAAIKGAGAAAAWLSGSLLENLKFSEGADFVVPPGFNNDTFPMLVESGEHVQVTPANQHGGGDNMSVELHLDGSVLGRWLTRATKNRTVIIHAGAVVGG